eukprot:4547926-Karenia_brevis.AAC.1
MTSLPEPLRFYITGHMYDETKLWSRTKGWGHRQFSTLAHHTQVAWKDAGGAIHDEDIIHTPQTLE